MVPSPSRDINLKFYVDQCVAPKTATDLRQSGFDAVWAGHVGHRGWDDPNHLVYALENGYTIITDNKRHFHLLHRLWMLLLKKKYISIFHLGILAGVSAMRPQSWVIFVHRFVSSGEDPRGALIVWDESEQKWQRF